MKPAQIAKKKCVKFFDGLSPGTNFLQGRVRRTPQSVVELLDDGREGALVGIVRSLGPGHAGGRRSLSVFSLPPCGVCLLCGCRWFILNKPLSQKKLLISLQQSIAPGEDI